MIGALSKEAAQAVGTAGAGADAGQLHVGSYYAASANRTELRPALRGTVESDVCVVGGGYTGLSAALALAEKGYRVLVLEAKAIGFGASGRNGGQVVNGLNASLPKIERQFGARTADFVGGLLQEGGRIIRERIETYAIDCDYRAGNIYAAYTAKHMRELEEKKALWERHGMFDHEMLDRAAMRTHVASQAYIGGMIDRSGGHMHALNLALGEADAIESLGGRIFEASPVSSLRKDGATFETTTDHGCVRSKVLILCGNAYLSGVVPDLEKRIMPVSTQVIATAPLGAERAGALLPTDHCVEDIRYVLDYFRRTADHRLLFGGGVVYGGTDPSDIVARLRPNLDKVFPQLKGIAIDFAWSGNFALSYSRVPQMGRLENGAYFAHGYSGHGVTGSHLFGAILAEAIAGDTARFDTFASLPYFSFPGGRALRVPYSAIGAWYYSLRDKLGL